jgi:hypothetical protein
MFQLPLPKYSEDDPIKLADWLEIYALLSADSSSSRGDLESALQRTGSFNPVDIETICADVFSELGPRSTAARRAYPFEVAGGLLSLKGERVDFISYIFCLCLSYFGWQQSKGKTIFPRRMFEDLAALAAKNFLNGDSYRFAAPRKDVPQFREALEKLSARMGEGEGCKQEDTRSAQDDNLDIVAWRHFPDRLPGKLLLFGQCATGDDWDKGKLTSLQPDPFCKYWFREHPPSPVIKAFFIPHRVGKSRWYKVSLFGGVMFDRCRLAYWVHAGKTLKVQAPYVAWVDELLSAQM